MTHAAGPASLAPVTSPPDGGSCRACPVRCERVVYPARCVQQGCARLYAHDEDGVRWLGCVDKVFTGEIDAARLAQVEAEHPGFGALIAERTPNDFCPAAIDRTFPDRADGPCVNPGFLAGLPQAPEGREPLQVRRRDAPAG